MTHFYGIDPGIGIISVTSIIGIIGLLLLVDKMNCYSVREALKDIRCCPNCMRIFRRLFLIPFQFDYGIIVVRLLIVFILMTPAMAFYYYRYECI